MNPMDTANPDDPRYLDRPVVSAKQRVKLGFDAGVIK